MPPKPAKNDNALYFIGLLAWLIPGAGHWLLGQRQRAAVIFVTISTTFLLGLALGSIEMIDPQNAKAWFCAQILCGFWTVLVTLLQNHSITINDMFGRGVNIGQVYAGVAGLLNLLCILDALYRAQVSVTERGGP
ncbi:MAG: hypothetical protein JW810_14740 [Sedimentisphaerales bacterium]|nr:hypothetical protein [Sedimentisphaerales bacterium]